ncbi:DinB family protein [Pedobacter aquatilis]|uniref:DinB family protein n=1 Tax=Pedobacter aquatilis TaxID=351343 RepID=UPI0029312DBD|nr:DinB family protein [Pedobacter aquatilis]
MKQAFEFIINSRKAFIQLIDGLTIEQLNKIPDGFNNNIIWNFGHIVVSTQTLCYVRTGILEDASSVKFVDSYKKDTKPTYIVSAEEVAELKSIALGSIKKIEEDYEHGVFANITPYSTVTYGVQLNTIEEVLTTTIGHDNLHFGYALALRKLV